MHLATESIRLVSGKAEFCPARSRVQTPPEAPITTTPLLEALFEEDFGSSSWSIRSMTED